MLKIAFIGDPVAPDDPSAMPPLPGAGDDGAPPAGNHQLACLARELAAQGCHVDIFVRRSHGLQPQVHHWQAHLRVIRVPAGPASLRDPQRLLPHMVQFAMFVAAFALRQRTGYHIVHAQGWLAGCVAQQLRRALGVPYVVSLQPLPAEGRAGTDAGKRWPVGHQKVDVAAPPGTAPVPVPASVPAMPGEVGPAAQRGAIEAGLMADADRIIVSSRHARRAVRRSMAVTRGAGAATLGSNRIAVVPDSVDPALFWPVRGRARRTLGLHAEAFVVLYASRDAGRCSGKVTPAQGAAVAIDAIALLASRHGVHAQLLLLDERCNGAAGQHERACLARLAAQRGVAGQLTFLDDALPAARRYCYSAADVLLHVPDRPVGAAASAPSPDHLTAAAGRTGTGMAEPDSVAVLEAMACATPVLAATERDRRSIVVHGHTGYVLPSADAAALAKWLAQLHAQPALARTLGINAWLHVHRHHTWRSAALRLQSVYRQVLSTDPAQLGSTDAAFGLATNTAELAAPPGTRRVVVTAAGVVTKDAQAQRVAAGAGVADAASAVAC